MGEPASLSGSQKKTLREAAVPAVNAGLRKPEDGILRLEICVKEHGVVYFEVSPVKFRPDRGYDYPRVIR